MVALMKKLCYQDLTSIENPEQLSAVKSAFTEIVTMMKYMGVFFTKLLIFIYTGKTKGNFRSDYHTLSLIMNTMLVPDYIYERYASFFAKVILRDDMTKWFDNRKILIKQKKAFSDLLYLNQFIIEEDKKRLIRKNTHATMSFSHMGGVKELLGAHITNQTMDINEFLAHLEVQVDLDLDEIFTKNLQSILEYFRGIDKFIDMTFKNTELEIKIDLMRLILRMTPSTKFVIYIYVLSSMKVEFLNECQIFALFCQVLLAELKKPIILEDPQRETYYGKAGDHSTTFLHNPSRQGSILVNFPPPGRKNSILEFSLPHPMHSQSVPDRKSREFFRCRSIADTVNDSQGRLLLETSNLSTDKDSNGNTTSCQNIPPPSPSGFSRGKSGLEMIKRLGSHESNYDNLPLTQLTLHGKSGYIQESDNEDEEESESQNSSRDSPIDIKKLLYEPKRISEPENTPRSVKTPESKFLRLNLFKVATGESVEEHRDFTEAEMDMMVRPAKETPAFYFKQLSDIPEVSSPEGRVTMMEFEVQTSQPVLTNTEEEGPECPKLSHTPCSLVIECQNPSDEESTEYAPQQLGPGGFTKYLQGLN